MGSNQECPPLKCQIFLSADSVLRRSPGWLFPSFVCLDCGLLLENREVPSLSVNLLFLPFLSFSSFFEVMHFTFHLFLDVVCFPLYLFLLHDHCPCFNLMTFLAAVTSSCVWITASCSVCSIFSGHPRENNLERTHQLWEF